MQLVRNGSCLLSKAMLEVAHRFPDHGVQLRSACLRALLTDPEKSLREAWTLNSRILEELLSLASNDIGDYELAKMVISWQEQNPHQNFAEIMQAHVSFGGFNQERFEEIRSSTDCDSRLRLHLVAFRLLLRGYHADQVGLGIVADSMWATSQASTSSFFVNCSYYCSCKLRSECVCEAAAGEWTPDMFKLLESKWGVQPGPQRDAALGGCPPGVKNIGETCPSWGSGST